MFEQVFLRRPLIERPARDPPSCLDSVGQPVQRLHGGLPVDAAVGNALAVDERLARYDILPARDQVALHHDAGNARFATGYLPGDIGSNQWLVLCKWLSE